MVTGAAGFIGRYVVAELARTMPGKCAIVAVDCMDRQAHPDVWDAVLADAQIDDSGMVVGPRLSACAPAMKAQPVPLGGQARHHAGRRGRRAHLADVRDIADGAGPAPPRCMAIIHLAARVGVGQSAYEPAQYASHNLAGTGAVLELAQRTRAKRLIVASSMSCYGEGAYSVSGGGRCRPYVRRSAGMAERKTYDPCALQGWPGQATPIPIDEGSALMPTSIYAESKAGTERLALIWGDTHGVPTTALRFFNVFGVGQSPRNPYTGVVAMFASAILRGEPATVYEDGEQSRDFIHVTDVARAVVLAIKTPNLTGPVNVGSGETCSVIRVAETVRSAAQANGIPVADKAATITGQFRPGDVRHIFADTTLLRRYGWKPQMSFAAGVSELVAELVRSGANLTPVGDAHRELEQHGLLKTVG
jgi:dTDP-L-rhamnose 4-epimerase